MEYFVTSIGSDDEVLSLYLFVFDIFGWNCVNNKKSCAVYAPICIKGKYSLFQGKSIIMGWKFRDKYVVLKKNIVKHHSEPGYRSFTLRISFNKYKYGYWLGFLYKIRLGLINPNPNPNPNPGSEPPFTEKRLQWRHFEIIICWFLWKGKRIQIFKSITFPEADLQAFLNWDFESRLPWGKWKLDSSNHCRNFHKNPLTRDLTNVVKFSLATRVYENFFAS